MGSFGRRDEEKVNLLIRDRGKSVVSKGGGESLAIGNAFSFSFEILDKECSKV